MLARRGAHLTTISTSTDHFFVVFRVLDICRRQCGWPLCKAAKVLELGKQAFEQLY